MFERYTEKSIKIIMLAQEEARRLGQNFVSDAHILLGLIGEGTGIASKSLKSYYVNLKDARIIVENVIGRGDGFISVEIPFTPQAKRALELAWEEARLLGHNYVGTEHLLLGLLRAITSPSQLDSQKDCAGEALERLGVCTIKLRQSVLGLLGDSALGLRSQHPLSKEDLESLDKLITDLKSLKGPDTAPTIVETHLASIRNAIANAEAYPATVATALEEHTKQQEFHVASRTLLQQELIEHLAEEKNLAENYVRLCEHFFQLQDKTSDEAMKSVSDKITIAGNALTDSLANQKHILEEIDLHAQQHTKIAGVIEHLKEEPLDLPKRLEQLREVETLLQERLFQLQQQPNQ